MNEVCKKKRDTNFDYNLNEVCEKKEKGKGKGKGQSSNISHDVQLTQGQSTSGMQSNGFLLLMRREQDLAAQDANRRNDLDSRKADIEAKRLELVEKYLKKMN